MTNPQTIEEKNHLRDLNRATLDKVLDKILGHPDLPYILMVVGGAAIGAVFQAIQPEATDEEKRKGIASVAVGLATAQLGLGPILSGIAYLKAGEAQQQEEAIPGVSSVALGGGGLAAFGATILILKYMNLGGMADKIPVV